VWCYGGVALGCTVAAMSIGDQIGRWWAHRKLGRGQCEWCGSVLPDDFEPVDGLWRACSPECVTSLWEQRTA
jgi:hypothetical protein